MAKITGPLHSDQGTGGIAKSLIFRNKKGVKFSSAFYFPGKKRKYTPSEKQRAERDFYQEAANFWSNLSQENKDKFINKAKGQRLSGYNFFMREYLGIFEYSLLGALRLGVAGLGKQF